MSELDTLVRRKATWIVQRIRQVQSADPEPLPREFVSGESVPYLGRHHPLRLEPDDGDGAKLRGGWLHVPAAPSPERRA